MIFRGFDAIVENKERLLAIVRLMAIGRSKPIECLLNPTVAYNEFKDRLEPP